MEGFTGYGIAGVTQTEGTVIKQLVPPKPRARTAITTLGYTSGATAHTLTVLRPIANSDGTSSRTTSAATGTTGNITLNEEFLSSTGDVLATSDIIAVEETDGVVRPYSVSGIGSGNDSISVTGNLSVGCAAGANVWRFGVTTTVDPRTGQAHPKYTSVASSTITLQDYQSGVCGTIGLHEPLLINSNNATNAGTIAQLSWKHPAV